LEKVLKKADISGESKNNTKRQLLNLYCKNKNLEKAVAFKDVNIYIFYLYRNEKLGEVIIILIFLCTYCEEINS